MNNKYEIRQIRNVYANERENCVYVIRKKFFWFWKTLKGYHPDMSYEYDLTFDTWQEAKDCLDNILDKKVVKRYMI